MTALAALQRDLQAHVLQRANPPSAGPCAAGRVVATVAADAVQRLGVYVHAYRARLLDVLGNDFPGLRALLGADSFEALCLDYIEATPSTHYNVRWYGAALAAHAESAAPWSATPACAEMATLEWNIGIAFDAAAPICVDAAAMAAVAPAQWPGMRLALHPSLQRQLLTWNVDEVRRSVDRAEPVPAAIALDTARPWVAWRRDGTVRHRRLEADEAHALETIERGATFAELCVALCDWHPVDAVAARAATFVRGWIDAQWVSGLRPAAQQR